MKTFILLFASILCLNCQNSKQTKVSDNSNNETTIYLIRHAEKDLNTTNNPELTTAGIKRAKQWANYFEDKNIAAVYSTNFKRTMATALPAATQINETIINYKPKSLNKKKLLTSHNNKNILIVGHSNTIPFLANKLIGANVYEEIDETIYNHLYKITIKNGKVTHELIKVN